MASEYDEIDFDDDPNWFEVFVFYFIIAICTIGTPIMWAWNMIKKGVAALRKWAYEVDDH